MIRAWMVIMMFAAGIGAFAESGDHEPVTPIETVGDFAAAKLDLGRRLFHDARLSHRNSVACTTCHRIDAGGDDGSEHSTGADGRPLDFNTPTIFNAASNFRLNWRG